VQTVTVTDRKRVIALPKRHSLVTWVLHARARSTPRLARCSSQVTSTWTAYACPVESQRHASKRRMSGYRLVGSTDALAVYATLSSTSTVPLGLSMYSDSSGPRRLVLASCTGRLSYVSGYGFSYDDNQFIFATR